MMGADGHDRCIDGDCWAGCPGCAAQVLADVRATQGAMVASTRLPNRMVINGGVLNEILGGHAYDERKAYYVTRNGITESWD